MTRSRGACTATSAPLKRAEKFHASNLTIHSLNSCEWSQPILLKKNTFAFHQVLLASLICNPSTFLEDRRHRASRYTLVCGVAAVGHSPSHADTSKSLHWEAVMQTAGGFRVFLGQEDQWRAGYAGPETSKPSRQDTETPSPLGNGGTMPVIHITSRALRKAATCISAVLPGTETVCQIKRAYDAYMTPISRR